MTKFKNSWIRLNRAADHLVAFKAELDAIFADNAFTTVTRYDKDSGWDIAAIALSDSTIKRIGDNRLSLELGEYAYQLRAALDGLIWDAITLTQGTEPPPMQIDWSFPFLTGKSQNSKTAVSSSSHSLKSLRIGLRLYSLTKL